MGTETLRRSANGWPRPVPLEDCPQMVTSLSDVWTTPTEWPSIPVARDGHVIAEQVIPRGRGWDPEKSP